MYYQFYDNIGMYEAFDKVSVKSNFVYYDQSSFQIVFFISRLYT